MRMHEVQTATDKKAFIQLAVDLYANDPNWIRPLDKDIEEVFDVEKNKFFKRGECKRWLLKDENDRVVGICEQAIQAGSAHRRCRIF